MLEHIEPPETREWHAHAGELALRSLAFNGFYVASGRPAFVARVADRDRLYRGSRSVLDTASDSSLSALLRHAVDTVPYYKGLPLSTKGESASVALSHWPILTKEIIRREGTRLQSSRPGESTRWNTSGGSTGEPVRLLQDRRMARDVTANKMVYMRWLGFRPGEPHLLIWGQPQATFGERLGPRKQIYRLLHNQTFLNCYEISNDTLRQWVDWITAHCPSIVEGYADALSDLSQYVLDRGIALPRPRGVITGAGVLSPQMRKTIARAFHAPVLNRYGSREVGDIACSCLDDTALHVDELSYVVEIVDSTGGACAPSVEGDVLVTVFSNYTMPLIRYRIEDRAAWTNSACACGRLTRRLLTVAGRRNDYLVAADGTHINGTALTTLLYPVAGIRRFQYRQTRDEVMLFIVTAEAANEATVRRDLEPILPRATQLLRGTTLRVEFVESISPSPSGKHRYILNELRGQPPADGHSASFLDHGAGSTSPPHDCRY